MRARAARLRLGENLREGWLFLFRSLSRRAPRRWRQGDSYLGARPRERASLPRLYPTTTGASWTSSKIISDSESFVRSCRLPCTQTRFLGSGTNVIVFASYKRNRPFLSSSLSRFLNLSFSLSLSFTKSSFRAHRINDRKGMGTYIHTVDECTERSRLIASRV